MYKKSDLSFIVPRGCIHSLDWTTGLDWNTGLDYWTDLLNHKRQFSSVN